MKSSDGYVTMADGIRCYYEMAGDGPETLVVLNGFYLKEFLELADSRRVVLFDLRNRGRSDYVTDSSKLERGIEQDVRDIDTARCHFERPQIDVLGHSYAGLIAGVYAIEYPRHARQVVQIGAMPPDVTVQYPEHLTYVDTTLRETLTRAAQLNQEHGTLSAEEFCKKFWDLLRVIYVADPANASKIRWDRCHLATEVNFMTYWVNYLLPSIHRLKFSDEEFMSVRARALVVHGKKDRSSPYGGAVDWSERLPNARLLSVENASHAPWIEVPQVMDAIRQFLEGRWPERLTL